MTTNSNSSEPGDDKNCMQGVKLKKTECLAHKAGREEIHDPSLYNQ